MSLSKKKLVVAGAEMSVIRHVRQLLEVLTGEHVELECLSLTLTPVVGSPDYQTRIVKVHKGGGRLYPSQKSFLFQLSANMYKKKSDGIATSWELPEDVSLSLSFEGEKAIKYGAKWTYSAGLYPEVCVIALQEVPNVAWIIGRDRIERHEVPMFPKKS